MAEQLKSLHQNYWPCALGSTVESTEPACCNCWSLCPLEPVLGNKRSHCNKKGMHRNEEEPPLAPTREKPVCSNEDPAQWINKEKKPGILFPTTTISNLLLDNFLQPKIWSIWHRHNISHRHNNNRQQQKNFLEPTSSGCCFILLCRKIPWKNDEIILSLPFFTTHSL